MYDGMERRVLDRFTIPGAKVRYRQSNGIAGVGDLIDLSRSAVRFESINPLYEGNLVELALELPNSDEINLKGHVIWTYDLHLEDRSFSVVQFLPFGSDERYNQTSSLDKLKAVEKSYLTDQISNTYLKPTGLI